MTKQDHKVIQNIHLCIKKILNSLIWRINHELIRIMVSKGRIKGELEIFLGYLQNLIKLDDELG